MKKWLYIFASAVIFLVIIFQAVVINSLFQRINRLYDDSSQLTYHIDVLKSNTADSWKYERTVLLNTDQIIDEDGRSLNKDYFDNRQPVLIFRFSRLNCSTCIEKQVGMLVQMIGRNVKYMLVGDYSNKRELGIFKRVNELKETVYACEKMLNIEDRTLYFCICYQGIITDVFFPDEDFPEMTENYLKEMSAKYFTFQ